MLARSRRGQAAGRAGVLTIGLFVSGADAEEIVAEERDGCGWPLGADDDQRVDQDGLYAAALDETALLRVQL